MIMNIHAVGSILTGYDEQAGGQHLCARIAADLRGF
jgi:hypothetical protein